MPSTDRSIVSPSDNSRISSLIVLVALTKVNPVIEPTESRVGPAVGVEAAVGATVGSEVVGPNVGPVVGLTLG